MARRSTIDQIVEWKQRRGRSRIGAELLSKVDDLFRVWSQEGQTERFADFVPIRLATIMEVYVRETIRQLIDSDPKYMDRSEPLTKNIKLDFILLKSLQGRRVSLGDIIAHSLPISSLAHILSIYGTLFSNFKEKLPESRERWIEDRDLNASSPPILSDIERVLANIERIFDVRHIVTHEMPSQRPYAIEEIPEFFASTRDFLSATDWILIGETYGDVPRTQRAMNRSAAEDLNLAMQEMENVLTEVRTRGDVDSVAFEVTQNAWEAYADAEAALHAAPVQGGSMYPMVWASQKALIVRARIEALRRALAREEGDRFFSTF
jgi:uncharacterized protein YecT (DUF1311 family)